MSDSGDERAGQTPPAVEGDVEAPEGVELTGNAVGAGSEEEGKASNVEDTKEGEGGDATLKDVMVEVRGAFDAGDADASRAAHDAKARLTAEEVHGGAGSDYVKSIVFGGLDGIITTFAIVAAVAGAKLDIRVIILLGFSNLIADAVSMGVGDYLSEKAELDMILTERKREAWEYENYPEGEKEEMVDLYVEKLGFDKEDAEAIIALYTKKPEYTKAFVDHMMVVELGHQVPDDDENPAMAGFVTFLSFIAFGSIPMWFYVIFYVSDWTDPEGDGDRFAIACVATAITLFALGFFKAKITKQNPWRAGGLMCLNGTLAAGSAYIIGYALEEALDTSGHCV